jgi:hypothetical protein
MKHIFKYITFVLLFTNLLKAGIPSVTITDDITNTKTDGNVTFTFNWSENVTGFERSDINVSGGTKGTFSGVGKTYTLVVTPTPNINNGTISVNVPANSATSNDGNSSTASKTQTQSYDTQSPAKLTLSLTNDSGIKNDDNITNDSALTIGSQEAKATLEYRTDGGSTWTTTKPTADGNYTLIVRQTDEANNTSVVSDPLTYTIDTILTTPTIDMKKSDSGVSNSDYITNNTTPTFIGTSTNDDNITLYIDGSIKDTTIVADSNYSLTSGILSEGTHTIYLNSKDKANDKNSTAVTVTIDTNSSVEITSPKYINNKTFSIIGTTDIENNRTIGLTFNSKHYTTTSTGTNFTIEIPKTDLTNLIDNQIYTAKLDTNLTDKAGNIATTQDKNITFDEIPNYSSSAILLDINSTKSSTLYTGDIDFYKITLLQKGYLTLDLNDSNISVSLHDYQKDDDNITDRNSSINIFQNVLSKGSYYIKVSKDTNGSYTLNNSFIPFALEKDEKATISFNTVKTLNENITDVNLSFIKESPNYIKYDATSYFSFIDNNLSLENTFIGTPLLQSDFNISTLSSQYKVDGYYTNEKYLYTIHTKDGLNIYDISDTNNTKLIAHNDTNGSSIVVNDRYAYIGSATGLAVVDIRFDFDTNITNSIDFDTIHLDDNITLNNYSGQKDEDSFKLLLNKSGTISFNSTNIDTNITLSVSLNSDFTNSIISNQDFINKELNITDANASVYYIKLSGDDNIKFDDYNFKITQTTDDKQRDKIINDITINDINLTTTSQTISGTIDTIGDIDLYKLFLSTNGILELNSTSSVELVDYNLSLSGDFATPNNKTIGYITSGNYYIKVSGSSIGDYNISVKFTPEIVDEGSIKSELYDTNGEVDYISNINITDRNSELYMIQTYFSKDFYKGGENKLVSNIKVYDANLKRIRNIDFLDIKSRTLLSSSRYENNLFVVYKIDSSYGLLVLDVADSLYKAKIVSDTNLINATASSVYKFDFNTQNKLILNLSNEQYDINISDVKSPSIVKSDIATSNSVVVENQKYTVGDTGLVVDTKTIPTGGVKATSITNIGDYLYVGTSSKGIYIYDISDKTNPIFIKTITIEQSIVQLQSLGNKLYISSKDINSANETASKITVLDIKGDYSDFRSDAKIIYNNTDINGSLYLKDKDYFDIAINSTGDFNVTLDSSDINCTLYPKDKNISYNCNVAIDNLPSGLYYIQLQNFDDSNITKYSLNTTLKYDDHLDVITIDNNKLHTNIQYDTNITGYILSIDDKDYFKLYVSQPSTISINNLTQDFNATLYSQDNEPLIKLKNNKYDIYQSGIYFIKIDSNTTGDYSFKISKDTTTTSSFQDNSISENKVLKSFNTNGDVKIIKTIAKYAYILDDKDGLVILDISDIGNPIVKNKISIISKAIDMKIIQSYVYVLEENGILEIFDIADKSDIRFISRYNFSGTISDIAFDNLNNVLYVANQDNGLRKLNISNISKLDINSTITDGNITKISIYNDNIYILDSATRLKVYDINGTKQTNLTKNISNIQDMMIQSDYLYIAHTNGLEIYDISNTNEVTLLGSFASTLSIPSITKLSKADDYIYLIHNTQVEVVDISTKSNILYQRLVPLELNDISNTSSNIFYAKNRQIDILEISPDYSDDFLNAKVLNSFPTTNKGQIISSRATDKDIFVFNTKYTGFLSIVNKNMTVNGKVSIYDSQANGMASAMLQTDYTKIPWDELSVKTTDNNTSTKDFNISNIAVNLGTFYIVIEDGLDSSNKTGGNYQFTLDFNHSVDKYINLIDDEGINFISTNGGMIEDSLYGDGGDIDFVDINISHRLTLHFTHQGDINPRITLFYKDGTQIFVSKEQNATDISIDLSKGQYKIKIDPYPDNNLTKSGDYKIRLSTTELEDILVENGLSKTDIDNSMDIKYLGNYIYVLTKDKLNKYTHLLKLIDTQNATFITEDKNSTNSINHKLFTYNIDEPNKILNYITTTNLQYIAPIVSTIKLDTQDFTQQNTVPNISNIFSYLEVLYISSNSLVYMYDGSTLQVKQLGGDNTNIQSYSILNISNIEVKSTPTQDIVYLTSDDDTQNIIVLKIDTVDLKITNSTLSIGDKVQTIHIDSEQDILYLGLKNKIVIYNLNDDSTMNYEISDKEYEGSFSSIFKRDKRVYTIVKSKGILIFDIDEQNNLKLVAKILGLGEYIDNIFSVDHRTVNYTTKDDNNNTSVKVYFFEDSFMDGETNAVYTSTKDGDKPQEGCFIATAAYDSYFEPNVKILRDFRDDILLTNSLGKIFVDSYYHYSPNIAHYIASNEFLKSLVRVVLTPIVYMIKYPITMFVMIFIFVLIRFEYNKRKGVRV